MVLEEALYPKFKYYLILDDDDVAGISSWAEGSALNFRDWDLINRTWENGYKKVSLGWQRLDPKNPRFRDKAKLGAEHIPIHSRLILFSKPTQILYREKILPGVETLN